MKTKPPAGISAQCEACPCPRICAGNIKVCEIQSGRAHDGSTTTPTGDHFKLAIPFAGQTIMWDVVFDGNAPESPPDFSFDDLTFLADPDVAILEKYVPSLAKWDSQDPKALMNVITELLYLYKKHQVALLADSDFTRLQFEYSTLIGGTQIVENDVEVLIQNRNKTTGRTRSGTGAVNFLIHLNVDFSGIPPVQGTTDNTGKDAAVLLVTFHSPDWSRITPQLCLSPGVEKALGNTSFTVPLFPQGNCLMDYVPLVMLQLNNKISAIIAAHEKKKGFVTAFMFHMGKALLEYDTVDFTYMSFLLVKRDFHFLLHINLSPNFPKECPVFTLQSMYHALWGKPFKLKIDDCPFSPRWEPRQMVERACLHIKDHIDGFQKSSIQKSQE
uniref:BRISC and BRCA1-A complex member 2 n=1 Tax=Timema douglasi TaxID=61478 RepID=A0A7R8VH73_TIMDO|nr:unnamed protein product [Timema douglasi]